MLSCQFIILQATPVVLLILKSAKRIQTDQNVLGNVHLQKKLSDLTVSQAYSASTFV